MTSGLVWTLTIALIAIFIAFDFIVVVRKPHEPTFKESVRWTLFYIGLAMTLVATAMYVRDARPSTSA